MVQKKYKIIIFGFLGLGDMIMFSPCLKILRKGFPNSQIVLVTIWKVVDNLFNKSPYLDKVIYFNFFKLSLSKKIKFIRSLRKQKFDISILPYPSFRREFNLASRMVGANNRYSFDFHGGKWKELIFLNNHLIPADKGIHNVENNFRLMQALGLKIDPDSSYDLPIRVSTEFVETFRKKNDVSSSDLLIGIHPGSDIRGKDRRLSIEKFAALSDELTNNYGAKVVVFLGSHEIELKEELLRFAKCKHIVVEGLELDEVAQIISICNIFISGDSGLMHLASAMKVPCVTIYGPTNPVYTQPRGIPHEIVNLDLECSPCFFYTEKHSLKKPLIECKIKDKFACIKKIEMEDILEKVDRLIQAVSPESTK